MLSSHTRDPSYWFARNFIAPYVFGPFCPDCVGYKTTIAHTFSSNAEYFSVSAKNISFGSIFRWASLTACAEIASKRFRSFSADFSASTAFFASRSFNNVSRSTSFTADAEPRQIKTSNVRVIVNKYRYRYTFWNHLKYLAQENCKKIWNSFRIAKIQLSYEHFMISGIKINKINMEWVTYLHDLLVERQDLEALHLAEHRIAGEFPLLSIRVHFHVQSYGTAPMPLDVASHSLQTER